MGVIQPGTDLTHDPQGFRWIHHLTVRRMVERLPVHVLHDDVKHPVGFPEIIHANQVRVVELRHRLRLGFEAFSEFFIRRKLPWQDFDRSHPVKRALGHLINSTHPPAGNQRMDIVGVEEQGYFLDIRSLEGGCVLGFAHWEKGRRNAALRDIRKYWDESSIVFFN